jgi:mannose-1-phosphate guanylyltransferase/mannose-6-phosphate isomerase
MTATLKRTATIPAKLHPVILCGGSGTRLWPLSRKSFPKQFSAIAGDETLFQACVRRFTAPEFAAPVVISGSDFRFIVKDQLAEIGASAQAILIEPEARNTAPAILAAALLLDQTDPGAIMIVAPSDHVIPQDAQFRAAVLAALPTALSGQIVTFGIKPDRAETGYGWLELSHPTADFAPVAQPLRRFVEKPDLTLAQAMLADGRHAWNAGIFLVTTTDLIAAFAAFAPHILHSVRASVADLHHDLGFSRLGAAEWSALPDLSIDYAVMEKAPNLSVMPYNGAWSDLGGWEAVWRESSPDAKGVVTQGSALAIDCSDSLLRSEADSLQLVGIGLENIVAVAMPDAVLITTKDRAQDVKLAVARLKAQKAPQAETFPRDHRPWGWYESLALGERFQVKRIVVLPGAALSLQSHHHRAEHWIVVQGTAKVTVDADVRLISENQSVYIPLGAVHRLENPGKVNMVLIEVQTGSYLGEDDIIRYDDVYARGQGAKG